MACRGGMVHNTHTHTRGLVHITVLGSVLDSVRYVFGTAGDDTSVCIYIYIYIYRVLSKQCNIEVHHRVTSSNRAVETKLVVVFHIRFEVTNIKRG